MRVAFIADVHANLEAFEAVLQDATIQRVKSFFSPGDWVNYAADCNEVLSLLKQKNITTTAGNHDYGAADRRDFAIFSPEAQKGILWTMRKLSEENIAFLSKLPEELTIDLEGLRLYLVHGSPKNKTWDYIFPHTSDSVLRDFLAETHANIIVTGHTHLPFIRRFGTNLFINPGSVGQPRDNNPLASYCILDTETLRAEIRRVKYDITATASKILQAGLPRYFAERLYLGR